MPQLRKFLFFILYLTVNCAAFGQSITVAVASNFHASAVRLAKSFEHQTGVKVKVASGASGVLYAQIVKGAPFDVFLSADKERPESLFRQNLAYQNTIYVLGQLALWMPKKSESFDGSLLEHYQGKLAVANAKLAPYGKAAQQVITSLSVEERFRQRQITGNNANQVFHYIDSGNVAAGFVPMSLLVIAQKKQIDNDDRKYQHFWPVPATMHQPIEQHAVVLKRTKQRAHSRAFVAYLRSGDVQTQLKSWGYAAQ